MVNNQKEVDTTLGRCGDFHYEELTEKKGPVDTNPMKNNFLQKRIDTKSADSSVLVSDTTNLFNITYHIHPHMIRLV